MNIWKLLSGIITFIITIIVLIQTLTYDTLCILEDSGNISAIVGIMLSILLLSGGIVSIATRNSSGNIGNIALICIFGLAYTVGTIGAADFNDLHMWAWWGLINALIAVACLIHSTPTEKQIAEAYAQTRAAEQQMPGGNVRDWYYSYGNQWYGPFTREQIPALIKSGQLNLNSAVYYQGAQQSTYASNSALRSYFPSAVVSTSNSTSVLMPVLSSLGIAILCVFISIMVGTSGNKSTDIGGISSNTQGNTSAKKSASSDRIDIKQLNFSVAEKISDGERNVFVQCTNESPYTISGIEITYTEKSGLTQEQKDMFYADIKETMSNWLSDEDIEEIKQKGISMHAENDKIIKSGEISNQIPMYYFSGIFYMKNISHFDLVEPDIATIKYVKDGKIYTEYYDYKSKKYTLDEEVENAFEWAKVSPLANLVPKPDIEVCKVLFDRDDLFEFEAYGCSLDDYSAYFDECIANGFTVNADPLDETYYIADDQDGHHLTLVYSADEESISVELRAKE